MELVKMKKQKIAVIGYGMWGKNIVRNFYNLNVLDTVCDLDEETREKIKTLYPSINVIGDMQEVIDARTDADGNTYTSLKERLDTEQANTVISLDVKRIELVDQLPAVEEPGVLYLVKN